MNRSIFRMVIVMLLSVGLFGVAQAARSYERTGSSGSGHASEEGGFDESVDPANFRKGNFEWDTQELIASGFKALHQDNERILRELADLKASLRKLEESR